MGEDWLAQLPSVLLEPTSNHRSFSSVEPENWILAVSDNAYGVCP